MSEAQLMDLVETLSEELGAVLEISCDPVELREVWIEAVEGLQQAKVVLGPRFPESAEAVLRLAAGE
jgi:hypothetical protein